MALKKLRAKLARRKRGRKRQLRKFKKTGRKGHRVLAGAHGRAARKLNALIEKYIKRHKINWNGCQPVGGSDLRAALKWALSHYDIYVTSTNGGTHTETSYHYRNQAVDLGASTTTAKVRAQHGLLKKFGPGYFAELFGPDNAGWVKDGQTFTEREGTPLEDLHDTHVHMAVTS